MRIIDISQEVLSCEVYDGDPKPCAERIKDMNNEEAYNLSAFSMCAHNGTHIDAPLHFLKEGKGIDEMPLEHFVGECFVATCNGEVSAEKAVEILEKAKKMGVDKRILIKGKVIVTEESARVFAEHKILLLGNEGQTVGPAEAPMQVHLILLKQGIALLEGIVLKDIPQGHYFLSAAPLNLAGSDGAPCRAYLIHWEEKL